MDEVSGRRRALGAGRTLAEMCEAVVGDTWVARKPKWERSGVPVSAAYVWRELV
ncbi:hypothetical protein ABZ746_06280 [Streptomyces sp. NPDC020096]